MEVNIRKFTLSASDFYQPPCGIRQTGRDAENIQLRVNGIRPGKMPSAMMSARSGTLKQEVIL